VALGSQQSLSNHEEIQNSSEEHSDNIAYLNQQICQTLLKLFRNSIRYEPLLQCAEGLDTTCVKGMLSEVLEKSGKCVLPMHNGFQTE
jgi:hypothetical protein